MREIIYKNLTSGTRKKKDIFLRETFEKDGVIAKTERRCFYYIKDVKRLEKDEDFKKWMNLQSDPSNADRRQFHIYKEHNDGLGADKLTCKIAGTFYAVADRYLYTIAFLHSFKVSFVKTMSI